MTVNTERLSTALNDRYRIERALGAGGMATVYLAHDLKHDRKVAVKVLKPELAAVLGAERFVVEIKTTASLSHPHILPLFDSGTADGFLFYVMPYIEGETLRDKLNRESQLGVDEAVRITREVADALDYAHRHGVIHRDIKPENILLHDGRPMVADFGIALAVSAAAGGRMTETGLSLGTPHYMSPEQATAEKEITARSDIYSLASVLYEMLAGQPPHVGGTAQQIIMKIITQDAADVAEHRKSVPDHVAAALMKALQKLPADRFESAKAFADALVDANVPARTRGTAARPSSFAREPRPTRLRRAAGLLVVGAALGAALAWVLMPDPVTGPLRRTEFQLPAGFTAVPDQLDISPDGRLVALVVNAARQGVRLAYFSWDGAVAELVPGASEGARAASFSPTGDSLAFVMGANQLMVTRLSGGAPQMLLDSGMASASDGAASVVWGDDGWVYFGGVSGIQRVHPGSRRRESVTTVQDSSSELHIVSDVLPGSRQLLVTSVAQQGNTGPVASIQLWTVGESEGLPISRGFVAKHVAGNQILISGLQGELRLARVDLRTGRLLGEPVALPYSVQGSFPFAVSPDGALVFAGGDNSSRLVEVDRGGAVTELNIEGWYADPRVSPDGRRLVMTGLDPMRQGGIWIANLDGSGARQVSVPEQPGFRPAWRPGRGSVTYATTDFRDGRHRPIIEQGVDQIWTPRPVAVPETRRVSGHAWSPDGDWLVYRTDDQDPGTGDILAIRPGLDSVPIVIAAAPFTEVSPTVSPDGRWLAYMSYDSGSPEVYVVPFPRPNGVRHRVSQAGGNSPVWSRDGRELFFVDGESNLVSVAVNTRAGFSVSPPQRLFSWRFGVPNTYSQYFDVSADGRKFYTARVGAGLDSRIVVVENFVATFARER